MTIDVVMPQLGESVTEGTVVRWLKQEGDRVERDEPLLEITTDKIDTDIPCVTGGILAKILVKEGEMIGVGRPLAIIETGEAPAVTAPAAAPAVHAAAPAAAEAARTVTLTPETGPKPGRGRFYSPLVKTIAKREGIPLGELDDLNGSGAGGRITKKDLLAYLERKKAAPRLVVPTAPAAAVPAAMPAPPLVYAEGDVEIVPMGGIRKAIAEHMVRSKRTSPHVTSFTEIDMTEIVRYRERTKDEFLRREGFKLTYTPFFIAAIIAALRKTPILNASVDGDKIVLWKHIHFGIAVGLEKGVIVPVIKHAEEKNFLGLARAAYDLAVRARENRLKPDDVTGGTFTLTNPGMFGTLFGTPIISQPQVGIIATGAVKKRVVVTDDDMIAIRSIMYMSLSYDHRVIDGLSAAQFTRAITEHLEQFDFGTVGS